jgi:hypothetical protein
VTQSLQRLPTGRTGLPGLEYDRRVADDRSPSLLEIAAALVVFSILSFFIAPITFGDAAVRTSPGVESDAVLGTVLIGSGMDRLLTNPRAFYDTPILYPDHNQLRTTEPFLGLSVLGLPLRGAGLNDAEVFELLRWTMVAAVLLYSYLLFRLVEVGIPLSFAGAALAATQPYVLHGIERIHVLTIALLVPLLFHLLKVWTSTRPVPHAIALFFFVALYPWGGVINACIAVMGVVCVAPLGLRLMAAQHRDGRLALAAASIALAVIVDGLALLPFVIDRSDMAVFSSPEFLAIKSWHDAPIPVKFSELPWFARDQLGWGLTGALLIIGALHVARRFRPIPVPPAVAPAFVTFAVLPVVSFALALCAAYPGGDVFLWCRSVFQVAVYAAFLVYWLGQSRIQLTRDTAAIREFVLLLSAGLGVFLCLMAMGPLYSSNRNPLSTHLMTLVMTLIPPVKAIREFTRIWIFGILFLSLYATIRISTLVRSGIARSAIAIVLATVSLLLVRNRPLSATVPIAASKEVYALASRSRSTGGIYVHPRTEWNTEFGVLMFPTAKLLGRPIWNGTTGIVPPWYLYAGDVFREFPSSESLWLLQRFGIDTVVSLVGDVQRGDSRFVQKTAATNDGTLYDLTIPEGAIRHPSLGACQTASAEARTVVPFERIDGADRAQYVVMPQGIAATRIEISFGQPVLARIPDAVDVFSGGAAERQRVNAAESGTWLRSIAADAFVHRRPAVASIELSPPQQDALTLEFAGGDRNPPITEIALCGLRERVDVR